MSEQLRTSDAEIDFRELADELIDKGAVALTADERLLDGKQILMKVHRPSNRTELDARINSLCEGIENVQINSEQFRFDYYIDPDPPHPLGFVAFYVAEWLGSEFEFNFSAVTLEEGISEVVSNST